MRRRNITGATLAGAALMLAFTGASQTAFAAGLSSEQMAVATQLALGAKRIGICADYELVTSGNAYRSRTPTCKIKIAKAGDYTLVLDISDNAGVMDWAKVTVDGGSITVDPNANAASGEGDVSALLFDSSGRPVLDSSTTASQTADGIAVGYKLAPGTYYAFGYCVSLVPNPGYSLSLVNSVSLDDAKISLSKKSYVLEDDELNTPDVTVRLGGITLSEYSHYSVRYSGETKIGTAMAAITGRGLYCGTRKVKYRILPSATGIRSVKARKTGAISYVTISWKKKPKYSGYQIRYSARRSMAGAATTDFTASKSQANIGIAGKSRGKRAYFQVRTFKKIGGKRYYSAWSVKRSVRTKK